MKILKNGNPDKILRILKFDCKNCGCIFEASNKEYQEPSQLDAVGNGIIAICKCPCCGKSIDLHRWEV